MGLLRNTDNVTVDGALKAKLAQFRRVVALDLADTAPKEAEETAKNTA
jgi:hypothetical protein